MAKQLINVGTTPNDGTGDTLRDAGVKVQVSLLIQTLNTQFHQRQQLVV